MFHHWPAQSALVAWRMVGRRAAGIAIALRALLLLAAACGGAAEDGQQDESEGLPERPIVIAPSAPQPEAASVPANEDAPSERDGEPAEIASLVSNPPERVDPDQFEALLGYYCVNCHATPACAAACDGFWFNDWAELAAGGNHGPQDAERILERVVARMTAGSMPPEAAAFTPPLPDAPRQLMIDFIQESLSGAR